MNEIISVLSMSIAMATPLVLGVLGGLFTYKAGVLNIAIEGLMTTGAFTSVLCIYCTKNILLGCLCGILVTIVVGLIFSVFSITLKGHNIIVGLGINFAAASIAPFFCAQLLGNRTSIIVTDLVAPSELTCDIPILRDIPILGEILNNQTPLTYFSFAAVFVMSVILYKTKLGTYTRVCGESGEAAQSVGIGVGRIKYIAVTISAITSALAGINIAVENLGMYTDSMISGRGFICLAAIYCGKGIPVRCMAYALLFGLARALQIKVTTAFDAATGQLLEMLPYLLIVLVMFISTLGDAKKNHLRGFKVE